MMKICSIYMYAYICVYIMSTFILLDVINGKEK